MPVRLRYRIFPVLFFNFPELLLRTVSIDQQ